VLRGWCAHFRPGVSSATFAYLSLDPPPGLSPEACRNSRSAL
jgi:hypothetical protein